MNHYLFATALCTSLALTDCAMAESAITFSGYEISGTANPSTRGWSFDVLEVNGIDLYALGIFDYQSNGLVNTHQIGVWDGEQNLLTTATMHSGSNTPMDQNGLFRLVTVDSIHLPQGTGYVIGAVFSPEPLDDFQAAFASGFQTPSSIAFTGVRFLSQALPVLMYPTNSVQIGPGLFGPTFEFSPSPVPEPSGFSLLFAGFASLLLRQYFRRCSDGSQETPFR